MVERLSGKNGDAFGSGIDGPSLHERLDEDYSANSTFSDTGQASSEKLWTSLRNHDVTFIVLGITIVMAEYFFGLGFRYGMRSPVSA